MIWINALKDKHHLRQCISCKCIHEVNQPWVAILGVIGEFLLAWDVEALLKTAFKMNNLINLIHNNL